jgi:hypothetical protein
MTAQMKRRIKRLEVCLWAVIDIASERAEVLERDQQHLGGERDPEAETLQTIINRIGRTLKHNETNKAE